MINIYNTYIYINVSFPSFSHKYDSNVNNNTKNTNNNNDNNNKN